MADDIFDKAAAAKGKGDIFDKAAARPSEAQQVAAGLPPVPGAPTGVGGPGTRPPISVQPSNLGTVITGTPLTGMEAGLPSPAQTPENARAMQVGAAIGMPAAGFISAPVATMGGLAGSAVGAKYGGSTGKYIGGRFGAPEIGETIGNVVGGISGGITGGMAGAEAGTLRNMVRQVLQRKLGSVPVSTVAPEAAAQPELNDLISRTQRLVKPGETPTVADLKRAGDLTQAPLEKLKALAKFGDRLAQNELNRRLKNE